MRWILWRLRHPREFFWEPIMKWLHRNRQLRIERDYWYEELQGAQARAADYKERSEFQYEMRCKEREA